MRGPPDRFSAIETHIATIGQSLVGVFPTEEEPGTSFTYTIGLTDAGWPELIIVGLPCNVAGTILNSLADLYRKRGRAPSMGDLIEEVTNLPLRLGSVSEENTRGLLCQSVFRQERVGGPFPEALQVVLCDREGRFPGQPEFDSAYMDPRQPCLAPDGDWDFWAR